MTVNLPFTSRAAIASWPSPSARCAPAARCFGPCLSRRRRSPRPRRRPNRELPKPTATDRFELDADSGDVVGHVQRTASARRTRCRTSPAASTWATRRCCWRIPAWIPGCRASGARSWCPRNSCCPRRRTRAWWSMWPPCAFFTIAPHKKGEPQTVYTHPIGIGRVGWKTPEGTTKIVARREGPGLGGAEIGARRACRGRGDPARPVVPAGPDNPAGPIHVPARAGRAT